MNKALRLPVAILAILVVGIAGVVLLKVAANEKHSVVLKWDPPAPKPGVTVAGYHIYRSRPDGSFGPLTSVVAPTYVDTLVSRKTTYYYFVKAVDAAGHEGLASNNAVATIP